MKLIEKESKVIGDMLWQDYPISSANDAFISDRLKAALELHGSDHLPVLATFSVS